MEKGFKMIILYKAKRTDSEEYVKGFYSLIEGRSVGTFSSGNWITWYTYDEDGFQTEHCARVEEDTLQISFNDGKSWHKIEEVNAYCEEAFIRVKRI